MLSDLQQLAKAATGRIDQNSSLDEIDKAASIVKASSDAENTALNSSNANAQFKLDFFKSIPSLAVPIISLLTLLATIWIQARQLEATRQQTEDTHWREFLKDIRDQSENIITDPTIVPRLKSFMNSNSYRGQVTEIAKTLIGSVANKVAFDQMFDIVYPDKSAMAISDIVDINRQLQKNLDYTRIACQTLSVGIDFPTNVRSNFLICDYQALPDISIQRFMLNFDDNKKKSVLLKRREVFSLQAEMQSVSILLAQRLRRFGPDNPRDKTVDLSGQYLYYVDLSDIDFGHTNLTDTSLDSADLTGTIITSTGIPSYMGGSNWWDAKKIDPNLLKLLIGFSYPGFAPGETVVGNVVLTKEIYTQRILDLCGRSGVVCDPSTMRFIPENFSMFSLPPRSLD